MVRAGSAGADGLSILTHLNSPGESQLIGPEPLQPGSAWSLPYSVPPRLPGLGFIPEPTPRQCTCLGPRHHSPSDSP